jgi:HK97 family phage major capsid protein
MTASSNDHFDQTVIRDFTVSRQMLDALRGVLPPCVVCGRPSAYRDFDGQWSHQVCSGESSARKRDLKFAARNGKIADDAGQSDLSDLVVIMREAEESALAERRTEARPAKQASAGPRVVIDRVKSPAERMAERAELMAHIRRGDPRKSRSPELIKRMTEREVYDLRDVRTDAYGRDDSEVINRARRAVDLSDFPTARDQEAAKDHIDRLLRRHDQNWQPGNLARRILNTGSEAYRRCLQKMVRAAFAGMEPGTYLDQQEVQRVTRALSVGSGASGGFAVAYQLDPSIVPVSSGSVNPFRAACRVEQISGTEWRQPTSTTGLTLAYEAEAAVTTDASASAALAQPAILTKRVSGFVPVSDELSSDWDSMETELGRLISNAKDDLEAVQFAVGVGTTVFPQGLVIGATTTVNGSAGAFALADLFALEAALPGRFRPRAQLFANRVHLRNIQKFNTGGGADVWVQDQVQRLGNFGGNVLGYPANEASGMVSTVTTGSKIVVLGDPANYIIVDAIGLDLELIPHIYDSATFFPKGQRGVYIMYRNSAAVVNTNAFRTLITT